MSIDTEARAAAPDVRLAMARISSELDQIHKTAERLAGERDVAVRELEDARRETGNLRNRAADLRTVVDLVAAEGLGVDCRTPDSALWQARLVLGLDPKTGHRQIREEADRG